MRIVTPFRPFRPESFEHKDLGRFDWVEAIRMLRTSAKRACGLEVLTITDADTELPVPALKYQTEHRRLMPWIVEVALKYVESDDFDQDTVMVSPDILVFGDLGRWFRDKDYDLGLLARPPGRLRDMNPMLNSVQFWPRKSRDAIRRLYCLVAERLGSLSEEQLVWGGDTTPFIELFGPVEVNRVHGHPAGRVRFLNADDVMLTFSGPLMWKSTPDRLVDFRYKRKLMMPEYFRRKFAPMLEVNGWFFAEGDRFMAAEINEKGEYQKTHLDAALALTKQRRVAVDGGAHVGTWSIPMAKIFRTVHAFEPSGDTFAALQANLEKRGVKNVKAREVALGKVESQGAMTLDGDERAKQMGNLGARHLGAGSSVRVVPLDSFELDVLDLLKLDIEGGEVDALKGAEETLRRCKPIVLFEDKNLWKRYGYGRRAPHDFLESIGAVPMRRVAMDEIWGWPA